MLSFTGLCSAATHEVDWKYGMEENHLCVAVIVENEQDWLDCANIFDTEPYDGDLFLDLPSYETLVYFVCGVDNHCSAGDQKLVVTIA